MLVVCSIVTTSLYGCPCQSGGVWLHSPQEVDKVLQLVAEGWNDCQISRATGINRSTVREWRRLGAPGHRGSRSVRNRPTGCPGCHDASLDEAAYAYLLGLYLGDGYIDRLQGTYRFRIFQDQRYVLLIELARRTLSRVRGTDISKVGIVQQVGCVAVTSYWNHWPCLFPQHGSGMKHQRTIRLAGWQREIVDRYPRQLVRGLIHADGCRVINRVWKGRYSYPRYFFTNTSKDILQIFREACDAIGVAHRDTKPTTISIARREDVAALDAFIGPKA